ncbi:DUF1801 domain-containing protein [Adhaeribacter arboris]|uniref:DUF1801 domain-containing protein n=1 Tax=Adhaeribacter arboris TaxID=2072846 RepID=A0A2T2YNX2_9BACT|nr:DUF1801 domain-containing protein [Adhaeribacter arboris]PSR57214.1 DUF1801 domain-containing protein [Adhaeribacter arboris]
MDNLNREVTKFLDDLHHPLRAEIEQLRRTILNADGRITENIKWNGPNYCLENEDRITMRIHPPKQIQLIFHRGVKKLTQPKDKIIVDNSGLLVWKENDRAVVSFQDSNGIQKSKLELEDIVNKWMKATKSTTTNR